MTTSNSKRKDTNKKTSYTYYNKAAEKYIAQILSPSERAALRAEPPKEQSPSTSKGGVTYGSDSCESERSPTPDHLRWPTPEYLRDYEWEARMEALRLKNEAKKMKKEEKEVEAMLLSDYEENHSDEASEESE